MAEILTTKPKLVEATLVSKSTRSIQVEPVPRQPITWQNSMKLAIRSSRQLLDFLALSSDQGSAAAEREFPVFVPLEYASRIRPGDPNDPLLLQVLATDQETQSIGLEDPVGDAAAELVPGLLKKYNRRALLIASGACAVHCRYCFRRHYPYQSAPKDVNGWQVATAAILQDPSIDEVILSGGDPLSASDDSLAQLIDGFNAIGHLARIRVHTRFPVMIPSRVCEDLLKWVRGSRSAVYFVLHINHVAEIDADVQSAIRKLRQAGAVVLNQAVLLAGVNDSFEAQRDLCLKLVDNSVLPYYIHQLDPVRGAMHFEVDDRTALEIVDSLRRELPGYAVPQLVREIAGQPHKTPVTLSR
jgi:EF-P beta-lysylation protein EpmB